MANEITHNAATGLTLYFCCFQQDGDVFLTGGATDEVWGTGGHTANNYDETMTEEDASGHYKGSMAAGIGAGVYQICVYRQLGASPANGDLALAQGEIYWDGTAEMNITTLDTLLDTLAANTGKIVYGSVTSSTGIKQSINAGSVTGFIDEKE